MSLDVTGKLHKVYDTQQIKENFSKREFILEITDESPSGMVYTNYASFQLINNNTSVIDQFEPGDTIKVSFNIRGNRWEKPDGDIKYITNLNAWRVEGAGQKQENPPSPGGFATGGSQNTNTNQGNPPAQPTQGYKNEGSNNNENNEENDDLPF